MLYRRLHENVLANFGFKRGPPANLSSGNLQPVNNPSVINNTSFTSDKDGKDRSLDKVSLPNKGHKNTNTMIELRPSNVPPAANSKNLQTQSLIPSVISRPSINQPKQSIN
jgi:hypothetical protein